MGVYGREPGYIWDGTRGGGSGAGMLCLYFECIDVGVSMAADFTVVGGGVLVYSH